MKIDDVEASLTGLYLENSDFSNKERLQMDEIKIINPNDYKIVIHFDDSDCYKELTGQCSLVMENRKKIYRKSFKRNDAKYCPKLYAAMQNNSVNNDDIAIVLCTCGHYNVSSGRHRLCICKHKNLPIKIKISYGITTCQNCP